jgi:hypothetical protein
MERDSNAWLQKELRIRWNLERLVRGQDADPFLELLNGRNSKDPESSVEPALKLFSEPPNGGCLQRIPWGLDENGEDIFEIFFKIAALNLQVLSRPRLVSRNGPSIGR